MASAGLLFVLGIAAGVQVAEPSVARDDPLTPDSVITIPGGPLLVVEQAAGLPVVAIRISAPLDPHWPGAARVLLDQALSRVRPHARSVGAHVAGSLEHGRMAVHVVGDRRDFETLAWIARMLAAPPEPTATVEALARESARRDRLAETPRGRLGVALESVEGDLPRSTYEVVHELWRTSHRRDRLRVLVLGAVPLPAALASLSRVGVLEPVATSPSTGPPAQVPGPGNSPLYASAAATFRVDSPNPLAPLVLTEALRAGIQASSDPVAAVRLLTSTAGPTTGIGVLATARSQRDADRGIDAALAILTSEGLDRWWEHGRSAALRIVLEQVSTPAGWLAVTDRTLGRSSPREALNWLRTMGRADLEAVLSSAIGSLARPRVDT